MKLVAFKYKDGTVRGGALSGATIRLLPETGRDDVISCMASGGRLLDEEVPVSEVTMLAPLQGPPRIFGIGLNYREHATEAKMAIPSVPTVFLKLTSSITGPDSDVLLAAESDSAGFRSRACGSHWEIGASYLERELERPCVGYTIVNDVSSRGVQFATSQWSLGKSFPTFTPIGPWIITSDELADPHRLDISLTLDGEVMQHANTRDLIFPIPELIEYISSIVPLETGDVISTGTPSGVGLGRNPQRWLQPDDTMVIEIEGIGTLRNRTRAATA